MKPSRSNQTSEPPRRALSSHPLPQGAWLLSPVGHVPQSHPSGWTLRETMVSTQTRTTQGPLVESLLWELALTKSSGGREQNRTRLLAIVNAPSSENVFSICSITTSQPLRCISPDSWTTDTLPVTHTVTCKISSKGPKQLPVYSVRFRKVLLYLLKRVRCGGGWQCPHV